MRRRRCARSCGCDSRWGGWELPRISRGWCGIYAARRRSLCRERWWRWMAGGRRLEKQLQGVSWRLLVRTRRRGVGEIRITRARVVDVRFPTSLESVGSDAVNLAPDYSAAYCVLETDAGVEGHGLTFTLGRGNELCVAAIKYLVRQAVGRSLESITEDLCAFSRLLTEDGQFRWLGPEKGVIHMAAGAVINAVWDLYAKAERKPVWRLLAEMPSERLVAAVDFRYIDDAISREEALEIFARGENGLAERLARLEAGGYPGDKQRERGVVG